MENLNGMKNRILKRSKELKRGFEVECKGLSVRARICKLLWMDCLEVRRRRMLFEDMPSVLRLLVGL